MTDIAFSQTDLSDSRAAGDFLGRELISKLGGEAPHAVILFSSSQYDPEALLAALNSACHPSNLIGCTSAGEFATGSLGTGSATALALRSNEMRFSVAMGGNIQADPKQAIEDLASQLVGINDYSYPFRSLLVLTDALAGQTEELMGLLNQASGGVYQIVGGGAGDDGKFESTVIFQGKRSHKQAVVVLEILSKKPVGLGISHGWETASEAMRVTRAEGMKLISINAAPALEAFRAHAAATGQTLDPAGPLPFFLHNILGIDTGYGLKLRVPLKVEADGSVLCAAEIPEGSTIHIMSSSVDSTTAAAEEAARVAIRGLAGAKPKAVLFFDCVATRLRMGRDFGGELQAMAEVMGHVPYVGCNTYGQIAKIDGQFNGFHNCTAVVCAFPE